MLDQRRPGLGLLGAIVLLALGTTSAQAATWYVGAGSNNSACGTVVGAPCQTVTYVLGNKVAAGDTIKILPGTYSNQGTITLTGTRHQNVTLTANDPANRPELQNTRILVQARGVTVSYLRVRGGSAPADGYWGVIEVSAYPALIDHNEVWNGGQGIFIRTSQQVTVSNNDVHHLGATGTDSDTMPVLICNWNNDPVPSGFAQAIRVTGNTLHDAGGDGVHENSWSEAKVQFNYLIIDNNKIYNNQEQGIDTKGTDDLRIYNNDIYGNGYGGISNNSVYGDTARWEIYNNRIHDHRAFAIFNQGGGSARKIWNNMIYNNVTNGPYSYCAVDLPSDTNTVFYENTVYNNTDTSGTTQTCGIAARGSGSRVINNVFYNNGIGNNDRGNIRNISGEDSGTPNYNYVYPTGCANGGQCKVGNNARTNCQTTGNCPGFVNIAARDFRLISGSPAIDGGMALGAQFGADASGFARGAGGAWDLGAFEFGSTGTPPPTDPTAPAAPTNLRVVP